MVSSQALLSCPNFPPNTRVFRIRSGDKAYMAPDGRYWESRRRQSDDSEYWLEFSGLAIRDMLTRFLERPDLYTEITSTVMLDPRLRVSDGL